VSLPAADSQGKLENMGSPTPVIGGHGRAIGGWFVEAGGPRKADGLVSRGGGSPKTVVSKKPGLMVSAGVGSFQARAATRMPGRS
jgi:hypothetical protein